MITRSLVVVYFYFIAKRLPAITGNRHVNICSVFLARVDTRCPHDIHGAITRDSETWLVATPSSRDACFAVHTNGRTLHLTVVAKASDHHISLLRVVVYPRNIKCPI